MEENTIENRVAAIEATLRLMQERNKRVELEKAWEVSPARRAAIAVLTYIVASLVLYLIGVQEFWLSAIIPTLGYLLSTISVAFLKDRWMR